MKVGIVGGTGTFGRALAKRLHEVGQDEVRVGSRDIERAQATAAELGVAGGRNQDIVTDADLVVLAVKSNATLETASELAAAIGTTPVLCVASDLRFTKEGVLPGRHQGSLAEEVARIVRAPVASGTDLVVLLTAALSGTRDESSTAHCRTNWSCRVRSVGGLNPLPRDAVHRRALGRPQ